MVLRPRGDPSGWTPSFSRARAAPPPCGGPVGRRVRLGSGTALRSVEGGSGRGTRRDRERAGGGPRAGCLRGGGRLLPPGREDGRRALRGRPLRPPRAAGQIGRAHV